MKRLASPVALMALLFCLSAGAQSEEVWNSGEAWGLNVVQGWVMLENDAASGVVSFADPSGHAAFQVVRLPKAGLDVLDAVLKAMSATVAPGSRQDFSFNGDQARWAEADWKLDQTPVHGYAVALASKSGGCYLLVAHALKSDWARQKDSLLSQLDSFFVGEAAMYLPGVVSQLAAEALAGGGAGSPLEQEIAVAQAVAEREGRVLALYQEAKPEDQAKAWRRFYQIIYRDNFYRLEALAGSIRTMFAEEQVPRERQAHELLRFVQDFKAETYDTLADLRVPVDAITRQAGDCDGRGLTYMILLEHLGFANILLVSSAYHHSMVGIDQQAEGMPTSGFSFSLDQKKWLVAETMAKVGVGLIDRNMSDPAKWMGFDLHFTP